jgi:hypothetical protein
MKLIVLRLAILPSVVQGGPDTMTPIQIVETIAQALDRRPTLALVTSSELLAGTADPLISTAERCGSDLECIRDRVRPSEIDLALRVVINHAVDPPVVSLHLIDAASAKLITEKFGGGAGDLRASLTRLAQELLDDAGHPEGARIRIALSPPDAEVIFPGARRIGPDLFLVAPGAHRIEAKRGGHLPGAQEVTVERGVDRKVELTLIAEPEPIVASPWLWVGVAAGAAVIAGVVVIAVVNPFRSDRLCLTTGPDCS